MSSAYAKRHAENRRSLAASLVERLAGLRPGEENYNIALGFSIDNLEYNR